MIIYQRSFVMEEIQSLSYLLFLGKDIIAMEEINNDEKKKIEIEIVKGNPKDLQISDVKDNLSFEVQEEKNKQKIIVPENQKSGEESNK